MIAESRDALWQDPDPTTSAGRDLWDRLVNEGYSRATFETGEARDVGQRICQVEAEAGLAGLAAAYTLLISSTPALRRAWRESPNPIAKRLNGALHDGVVEWCRRYQAATGRADQGLKLTTEPTC